MIYVYGVTDGRPARLGDLHAVEHGALAGVYSAQPPHDLTPTEENLWQHEHVLERLMGERAVLPLRFGSTLRDAEALRDLLRERELEFATAIAAVRGRVEMGVRASVAAEEAPRPDGSGRAYLEAKLARRRAAAQLGESLHTELSPLARAATYTLALEPRPTFAGAYLVERDQAVSFRSRCDEAAAAHPEVELACTGPWPPFSFAQAVEAQ